jgi:hypothetical protein
MASRDEFWRLFYAATRPADDIAEVWKAGAVPDGVEVTMFGTRSFGDGDPLHHYLECNFEPGLKKEAKRAVAELSRRLGVPIADIRNVEHERIWEDISEPE